MLKFSKISLLIAGLFMLAFNVHAQETLTTVKSLLTAGVQSITENSATSGGGMTFQPPANGSSTGIDIKEWGICWSLNSNPTVDNDKVRGGNLPSYSATMTNLARGTKYYVRAYVVTISGAPTIYGDVRSFTTKGVPIIRE
jgi:hypothetical protein